MDMDLKRGITLIVRKVPIILFAFSIVAMILGFHNATHSEPGPYGLRGVADIFAFYYGYIPAVVVPPVALGLMLYIASLQLSSTTSKEKLIGLIMLVLCVGVFIAVITM